MRSEDTIVTTELNGHNNRMNNMETPDIKDLYLSIISIVLEGDLTAFSILKKQLPHLEITSSSVSESCRTIRFSVLNGESHEVVGSEANMEIIDTRLLLQTGKIVFVKLIVLGGLINTLIISGESIQQKSEVASYFWSSLFSAEISPEERCFNANQRNYEKAIGYYPSYK